LSPAAQSAADQRSLLARGRWLSRAIGHPGDIVILSPAGLFGFRLLLEPLDFHALALDLLLLRLKLGLRLLLSGFLILHLVAYRKAAHAAQGATDRRAGARRAYCGADYRAGRRTESAADQRSLLARGQWLSRASKHRHGAERGKDTDEYHPQ
jgi:hypothetical protein